MARERGIVPVWMYVPRTTQVKTGLNEEEREMSKTMASEADYITLDLTDVFNGYELDQLWLAPWDDHPNAFAHGLLGEELFEQLVENQKALNLRFSPGPAGAN